MDLGSSSLRILWVPVRNLNPGLAVYISPMVTGTLQRLAYIFGEIANIVYLEQKIHV